MKFTVFTILERIIGIFGSKMPNIFKMFLLRRSVIKTNSQTNIKCKKAQKGQKGGK